MKLIKSPDINNFFGKKVRIVYHPNQGVQVGSTFIVDYKITPEVLLKKYDSQTKEITFEREGGKNETLRPDEVWDTED